MTPRVPSKAIAFDSAIAERPRDLSQKHIEVASQELYAIMSDLLHQSIQECMQCHWPFKFHGFVMPMHSKSEGGLAVPCGLAGPGGLPLPSGPHGRTGGTGGDVGPLKRISASTFSAL